MMDAMSCMQGMIVPCMMGMSGGFWVSCICMAVWHACMVDSMHSGMQIIRRRALKW